MEQLVILIVIGLVAFVQWLIQQSAQRRAARREQDAGDEEDAGIPWPVRRRAPEVESEAALRRLREALGLPPDGESPVPPSHPVAPSSSAPPLPSFPRPRSRSGPAPPPLPVEAPAPRRLPDERPLTLVEAAQSLPPAAPPPRPAASPVSPRPVETASSSFRRLLAGPQALRDAVILSEILGAPKALR